MEMTVLVGIHTPALFDDERFVTSILENITRLSESKKTLENFYSFYSFATS